MLGTSCQPFVLDVKGGETKSAKLPSMPKGEIVGIEALLLALMAIRVLEELV